MREWPVRLSCADYPSDGGANSAVSAVGVNDTAYPHRDKLFTLQLYASKPKDASTFPSYGRPFITSMRSTIIDKQPADWPYGMYANYIEDGLSQSKIAHRFYSDAHYSRLLAVKSAFDPTGTIRFPASIRPLSS